MQPSGQKMTHTPHWIHCSWFPTGRDVRQSPVRLARALPGSTMAEPTASSVHFGLAD